MPIAAVPNYLGQDFSDASPGMRFGLLLAIWTNRQDQEAEVEKRAQAKSREGNEIKDLLRRGMDHAIAELQQAERNRLPGLWDKNDFAARDAWSTVKTLTPSDRARMKALTDRQSALSDVLLPEQLLRLDALTTAPFTTGLGNEHPLKNGFAFLNPYGLPYLPGSGVKGVLRCAARELAGGEWGDRRGWSEEKTLIVPIGKDRIALSTIDALFGLESKDGETEHVRGALSFWDVIPQIQGDSLMVEIMTPHQGHYYQQKRDRNSGDSTTPHDSGQPTPISFLTVPAGSSFIFHVVCDLTHLQRLAPDLARDGSWKTLLQAAFEHAFEWLGFGAKTAVGYGAMARPPESDSATGSNANRGGDGAVAPGVSTESVWSAAKLNYDPGRKEIRATFEGKSSAGLKGPEVDALLAALGDRERKLRKDKELKNVAVRVRQEGNLIQLLGLA